MVTYDGMKKLKHSHDEVKCTQRIKGGSRIFLRGGGCTTKKWLQTPLMVLFVYFGKILLILESRSSFQGGGGAHSLHRSSRSAPHYIILHGQLGHHILSEFCEYLFLFQSRDRRLRGNWKLRDSIRERYPMDLSSVQHFWLPQIFLREKRFMGLSSFNHPLQELLQDEKRNNYEIKLQPKPGT